MTISFQPEDGKLPLVPKSGNTQLVGALVPVPSLGW